MGPCRPGMVSLCLLLLAVSPTLGYPYGNTKKSFFPGSPKNSTKVQKVEPEKAKAFPPKIPRVNETIASGESAGNETRGVENQGCGVIGKGASAQHMCTYIHVSLAILGIIVTFSGTKSDCSLAFWTGFVSGCLLTFLGARGILNMKDGDLILFIGILVGVGIGIASTRMVWIAHGLSTIMIIGVLVYGGLVLGPFIILQFGDHWWIWAIPFVIAIPAALFGWILYRMLAFLAKTALGALLVTRGLEYILNTNFHVLNSSFRILKLVDGSNPQCHGATCVAELSFWIILTLIASFVHNFGVARPKAIDPMFREDDDEKLIDPTASDNERTSLTFGKNVTYDSMGGRRDDLPALAGAREGSPYASGGIAGADHGNRQNGLRQNGLEDPEL